MKNATVKDDVVLNEALIRKIEGLADEYALRTGKKLLVTDGHRTPLMQATAMYNNLKYARDVKYGKADLYMEIYDCWCNGFYQSNYPAEKTIADMVRVIDMQILAGKFISQHLVGNAADFSRTANIHHLESICREEGHFFMAEVHCFHVTFA